MRSYNHGRFQQQASFLRRQFLQDGDLPFTDVLSEGIVAQALTAINVVWLDRIYSPLVTLWVFLGQVLSADPSCRAAVARLIAHRLSRGQRPCSAETGAYCQARKRLPEEFFAETARQTGRALQANVNPEWLWKGRRVYAYDGATVTMPDTPENQAAYPQPVIQASSGSAAFDYRAPLVLIPSFSATLSDEQRARNPFFPGHDDFPILRHRIRTVPSSFTATVYS